MSHMTQIELKINDLDALDAACGRLGLELRRDRDRFQWYGQFMGDSAGLQGIPVEDYDKCAHAIGRVGMTPGHSEYEIGVVASPDGGYTLRLDTWGPGQRLAQLCGGDLLPKLKDEYAYAVAESYWLHEGYETEREVGVDGSLTLIARQ